MRAGGYWLSYGLKTAADLGALRRALESRMRVDVFHEGEMRFECLLAWGAVGNCERLNLPGGAHHLALRGWVAIENVPCGEALGFIDVGRAVSEPGFSPERVVVKSVKGDGRYSLRYFAKEGILDFSVSKLLVEGNPGPVVSGLNEACRLTGHPEKFAFKGALTYPEMGRIKNQLWAMGLRQVENPDRYVVSFRWQEPAEQGVAGEGPVGPMLDVIRGLPERPVERAEMTYQTPDGIAGENVEEANLHLRRMIERAFGGFAGLQLNYAVGFSLGMDEAVTGIPAFLKGKRMVGEAWEEDYCALSSTGDEPIRGSGSLLVRGDVLVLQLHTNRDIEGLVFEKTGMLPMGG